MKTSVLLFCAALAVCITQQVNAKTWRVNNNSNYNGSNAWGSNYGGTQSYPVFAEIDDAIQWSSVLNGDTLQVEGSGKYYETATITKKLVIIGPGYYLNENPQTSTNALNANFGAINFNLGSDGSQLIGVNNIQSYPYNITINVNNVVIKRCRIENTLNIGSGTTNISILENFFANTINSTAIELQYPYILPSDIYFNNNICQKKLEWNGVLNQCNNNVFDGPANTLDIQINTAQFQNNILKSSNATVNINNNTNNYVSYCISSSATGQFGNSNNNIVVTNISSIFVPSGTSDGKYQIKAGTVADNSGSDGTDRGAFGGAAAENRYTLSGLAAIPDIYDMTTTGVAGPSGLPVTIKAKIIK